MYFDEQQNQQFFHELAQRFSGAEIHFDILNKWMSTKSALHDTVSKTNAVFKFGIDREQEIERWHPKLKYSKSYSFKDFRGWQRMGVILTTLMSVIPQLKNASRILVYKIAN